MTGHVRIVGTDLPGVRCGPAQTAGGQYANIHVGVQRRDEVVALVPGNAERAVWTFEVDVRNGRFAGPYVHGRGDERFVYVSWGELDDGRFTMFRRAKLQLDSLDPHACDGRAIDGHLGLTDANGHPLCASVRPPRITWTVR